MKSSMLVLFLTMAVAMNAQQKGIQTLAQMKESPAGSKIIEYIKMVNGEEAPADQWLKKLFTPKLVESMGVKKLQGLISETREMEGQLHLYTARRTGMFKYKLLLKGVKSGEWLAMVFTFEEDEPYRILGITLDSTEAEPDRAKPLYPQLNQ
ncbi:MAG: hypothetical protein RIM99_14985 [Cyclobacteriaceae bacterium]